MRQPVCPSARFPEVTPFSITLFRSWTGGPKSPADRLLLRHGLLSCFEYTKGRDIVIQQKISESAVVLYDVFAARALCWQKVSAAALFRCMSAADLSVVGAAKNSAEEASIRASS
jgi:hypothetical protein